MLEKKYLKLQNGSDVRGVALEGIEGEAVNLTPEIAKYIAAAFAEYLSEKCRKEMRYLTDEEVEEFKRKSKQKPIKADKVLDPTLIKFKENKF